MNAFDTAFVFMSLGSFGLEASKRNRMSFALGMRDARNGQGCYDSEEYVNNGYESDCYWAGRMVRDVILKRSLS